MTVNTPQISKNHLAKIRKFKQKKFRSASGLTLVEGYRAISQISDQGLIFKELYFAEEPDLTLKSEKYFQISEYNISKLCSTKNPQSIVGLIKTKLKPIADIKSILYLDGIREPGNLGTIVRTAAAAGISGIAISPDCCDIFNPKVVRSSLGSVFYFPIEIHDHLWLQIQTANKIASSVNNAANLYDFRFPTGDTILIIGSEAFGISDDILNFVDQKVTIPNSGNIESLNAAVAAGILMFQYQKNAGNNAAINK